VVDVQVAENHVGHGVRWTVLLGQPSRQEFADLGRFAAGHQPGREPAAQIEDDPVASLVGGQETAERDRQQPLVVDCAVEVLPDGHRHVGVEHARRHRLNAVGERVDRHVAYPHGSPPQNRSLLGTNRPGRNDARRQCVARQFI
jgi:hypothetical protein